MRRLLSVSLPGTMNPARYRIRLFLDLCRVVVLPSLAFHAVLKYSGTQLGFLTQPIHFGFIISWFLFKGALLKTFQDREAGKLGARPIPRIVGRWPGNIDVLLKILRASNTSYIQDVHLNLFEEYQCTTLNTRILWSDAVCMQFLRALLGMR